MRRGDGGETTPGQMPGSPPGALGNTPLTWTHPWEILGPLCALPKTGRVPRLLCLACFIQEFAAIPPPPTLLSDPS